MHKIRGNLLFDADKGIAVTIGDVAMSEELIDEFTIAVTRAGTTVDTIGGDDKAGAALRDLPVNLHKFNSILIPLPAGLDPAISHGQLEEPVKEFGRRIVDLDSQHQHLLESLVA